jgi:hypothetical protein
MRIDTSKLTIKQLIDQKKTLIKSKKSLPITSDPVHELTVQGKPLQMKTKAFGEASDDPDRMKVKFIGSTALFCDSHMDVLAVGCYDRTLKDRAHLVPHLVDHIHSLKAKVGKTIDITTEVMNVSSFGIDSDVQTTEVLTMESELNRKWDEKVFQLYKDEEVNQHSIGMQYVNLKLAVNDEEYKEEFELWQKVYPEVINKERVDKAGYFWYVTEIKLFEISAVLFGSNELTPTTETQKELNQQPSADTAEEVSTKKKPSADTSEKENERRLFLLNS